MSHSANFYWYFLFVGSKNYYCQVFLTSMIRAWRLFLFRRIGVNRWRQEDFNCISTGWLKRQLDVLCNSRISSCPRITGLKTVAQFHAEWSSQCGSQLLCCRANGGSHWTDPWPHVTTDPWLTWPMTPRDHATHDPTWPMSPRDHWPMTHDLRVTIVAYHLHTSCTNSRHVSYT